VELVDQELEAALTNGSEPITGDSNLKPMPIVIDDGAWCRRNRWRAFCWKARFQSKILYQGILSLTAQRFSARVAA
jgi:hypothetical protein